MIDRSAFVARWQARAADAEDTFDQFFCLWIALVIQARPQLDPNQVDSDDTDRVAVLQLAQRHTMAIVASFEGVSDELKWLARRKGTRRGDAIVDVHDYVRRRDHLRTRFQWLTDHYTGARTCKPGLIVAAAAELLNHVRNNLFHGIKDPDDVEDEELVRHLLPVLRAFLKGAGG
ncbi:MAG: hypothetical protein WD688_20770 [Candidatus Binatia bacterium]